MNLSQALSGFFWKKLRFSQDTFHKHLFSSPRRKLKLLEKVVRAPMPSVGKENKFLQSVPLLFLDKILGVFFSFQF
jgi:hypothetical protein